MMNQFSQFVMQHWGLWLILAGVLLLIIINEYLTKKNAAPKLSTQALIRLMNDDAVTVWDLRDLELFQKGHIANSTHIKADAFSQKKMQTYQDKAFVLIGANGTEASTLANSLKSKGFAKIMVLDGGIAAWRQADLPLVKGK